jgi:hypothetical protein
MPKHVTRALGLPMAVATLLFVASCGASHGAGGDHALVSPTASVDHDMSGAPTPMPDMHTPMPGMDPDMMPVGDGRSASAAGLTLRLAQRSVAPKTAVTLRFQITDAQGMAVTTFAMDQTKLMHFYLVRSDLTGYQHLHPEMAPDGTWSAAVQPLQAGTWRAYTSFIADHGSKQTAVVLGDKITVPGEAMPQRLPKPTMTTTVDGYTLTVHGDVMAHMSHELSVTVTCGGKRVTDLEPYLESYAHLSAFHKGDLTFAHLHPHGAAAIGHGGPKLIFETMFPQPGNWRMYLQFQTHGTLHTAAITLHFA